MPAVYLFNKRTLWGGDDLQLPALITMLVRVLQVGLFVTPMSYWIYQQAEYATSDSDGGSIIEHLFVDYSDSESCHHSHYFPLLTTIYLFATFVFSLVSLVLEHQIFYWTCQGRPTQTQPRTEHIENLLEMKLFVFTLLLTGIVLTYCTTQAFAKNYRLCLEETFGANDRQEEEIINKIWVGSPHSTWWIVSSLLAVSQLAEIILATLFWIRLRASNRVAQDIRVTNSGDGSGASAIWNTDQHHHEMTEELWEGRCHNLCQFLSVATCCLFGGHDLYSYQQNAGNNGNYYEHVARALADYLETGNSNLDVVPTDILAGLLILQRLQRQRILKARLQVRRTTVHVKFGSPSEASTAVTTTAAQESSGLLAVTEQRHESFVIPTASTKKQSPLTLRSRSTSSNDLVSSPSPSNSNNNSNSTAPLSPPSSGALHIDQNKLANSMNLSPEAMKKQQRSYVLADSILSSQPQESSDSNRSLSQRIFRRTSSQTVARNHHQASTSSSTLAMPDLSDSNYYQAENRKVLNPLNPVDCQRLQDGSDMAKYALCIYTWMLYVYAHPFKGLPQLVWRSTKHKCLHPDCDGQCLTSSNYMTDSLLVDSPISNNSSNHPSNQRREHTTQGDNYLEWHKHALLLVAGLEESELVYAQFENRVSFMPYCIMLDHSKHYIIVSIRGSLSLEDLVTDVHVDPEPIQQLGIQYGFDATNQFCHAGVVKCTLNIYEDIERRLLEIQNQFPNYQLRLCGHSLGGGICTLLGFMLRSKFPSLHIYSYSPPGCTMTWELATKCEPWTTTFVLDSDIVPRLSVAALEDLRDQVLQLIGRLKVPKYHVVQSLMNPNFIARKLCFNRRREEFYEQDLQELNLLIDELLDDVEDEEEEPTVTVIDESMNALTMATNATVSGTQRTASTALSSSSSLCQRQVSEFLQVQEQRKQARFGTSERLKLYPPGRMIHLVKTGETGGCGNSIKNCITCGTSNSGFLYTPVYVANDDLDEIVVTPTMGTDHFIDRMVDELSHLAGDYCSIAPLSETRQPSSGAPSTTSESFVV